MSLCCWKNVFAMNNVFSWQNSVSLCHASFCISRPNLHVTPDISRLPTFAFQSPMMKKTSFFDVSSRRSCRSSKNHSTSAALALVVWGIDLDNCDIEWFAFEMNRDHSVVFEIAPKYCTLDSFVDYEGYSISSKEFLPLIVNIMVIWINFTHPGSF